MADKFEQMSKEIMDLFKAKKSFRAKGSTPDGSVWVASYLPNRKHINVLLKSSKTGVIEKLRFNKDEQDKLIAKLKELYSKDENKQEYEELSEDTVYDHSWYEVEDGDYPKRTKEGVIVKESYDEPIQDTDWNSFVQKIGKRYLVGNTLCWHHLKTYIKVTKNGNVYIMQHNDILRRAFADCKTFDDIYDKLYTKNLLPSVTESHITESKNENNDEIERIHNEYLENKLNAFQAIEDLYIYTNFSTKEIDEILYKWLKEKEKIKSDKDEKELNETASCGATCAGSVSPVSIPMGKIAKRKRKKVSEELDSKLFKESILNDMPCESEINNHKFKYFMNEGKWYMGVDNCLVKTHDKKTMMETFDQIVDEMPVSASLLEDYSCYEMDLLMEEESDVTTNPTDVDSNMTSKPTETSSDVESEPIDSISTQAAGAAIGSELNALDNEEDSNTIKSSDELAKEELHNEEILGSENQEGVIQTNDGKVEDITIGKTETIKDKSGKDMDVTHYKDSSGRDLITKTNNISLKNV